MKQGRQHRRETCLELRAVRFGEAADAFDRSCVGLGSFIIDSESTTLVRSAPAASSRFPFRGSNTDDSFGFLMFTRDRALRSHRYGSERELRLTELLVLVTVLRHSEVYAQYIDDEGVPHQSPQFWADYAECLYLAAAFFRMQSFISRGTD